MKSIPELIKSAWFDGETIDPELDEARLKSQSLRVFMLMRDGQWRTLADISWVTGAPEASVSARLRDFRKEKFGEARLNRRRINANGLWEYQLLPPINELQGELFSVMA